jgi:hypothetical protein
MIEVYVNWSIYVRTSNLRKLREAHIPPITAALESLDFDWEIRTEDESPGEFRLVTYQNLCCPTVDDLVITTLRRAYRLADGWCLSGLRALSTSELRHAYGFWKSDKPSNRAPAVVNMMFEIEPGRISRYDKETGGWQVVDP